jgi:hypothetical protein
MLIDQGQKYARQRLLTPPNLRAGMTFYQLCRDIRQRHKSGESYRLIAQAFGISKAMAWQIYHGHRPGKRISAILHLDPTSTLKSTRSRRERLDRIARIWGHSSWCAYETAVLNCNGGPPKR